MPDRFKEIKKVRVIIEEVQDSREEKIKLIKKASNDPMFLADINEVSAEFENSDK